VIALVPENAEKVSKVIPLERSTAPFMDAF
jgi:hypothetical protein